MPIFEALAKHDVEYLVVGSFAAILQNVDLPLTDIDIVLRDNSENNRKLVRALEDLGAQELVGEDLLSIYELSTYPDTLGDTTFRTFLTDFGGLDVVKSPAAFSAGYPDLLPNAQIVSYIDPDSPGREVEVVVADAADIFRSKRAAGRPKDIAALPAFKQFVDPEVLRQEMRARYLAETSDRDTTRDAP
jgi:hypothetical protein